jgi:hypothetical protein
MHEAKNVCTEGRFLGFQHRVRDDVLEKLLGSISHPALRSIAAGVPHPILILTEH